ncbi:Aspartate/methionine/tyrosine aminotransferase [Propionibacterium cyclohexanicum]|uniref:Aminotransferase n=1 Tax=Propionibacterium cyclohexanicum TaxID=64702 RepID=A0A1H9TF89_9ACTN|nr:aminotransferase class I/II-fold pyridoxal phosphate-dependent enzyme [Propionibacterium cyclohexanicum]SER95895.1 Aspartate/methionine/tyrosine aminotransferase [Propionibacterium cyclohexanicum]
MQISRRAQQAAPFHVMEVAERASELAAQGADVICLNVGEPDFGAAPAVLGALAQLKDQSLGYTGAAGLPPLRAAIADFYRARHGVEIDPSRVIVTSGATGALLLALAALVDPGDEVLMADPTYPCNVQIAEAFGARVRLLPTVPAQRYQLDAALVESSWSERTRGVMVASPANPTGSCMSTAELGQLSGLIRERSGWLLCDEIYLDLTDGDAPGGSRRSVLNIDPDAVVVNSFSKFFGMTGWRLGWAIVPPELVEPLERLSQNYVICPSVLAQRAALECFTPPTLALLDARRAEFRARRDLVLEGLDRLGIPVPVAPDGAFYVYMDVSGTGLDSAQFCTRVLREAHVALTPGVDFGPSTAATHVRLSYSASREKLSEALRRLDAFLGGL